MYVAVIPNRRSPPAILLREGYREAGKTKNRTLANLSHWSTERIEQLRAVLRGERLLPAADAVEIVRALPHGHVLAAVTTARRGSAAASHATTQTRSCCWSDHRTDARSQHRQSFVGRGVRAGRCHSQGNLCHARLVGLRAEFHRATLARRHLKNGALLLYDVTSIYLEGRCCEPARHGYSRDHRRDRPQLVIGLLCAADGCPVAAEVFEGNTADPMTLSAQIDKLKQRFRLPRVVMVGDRGMLTDARIEQTLRPAGLDWITALPACNAATPW